jgi:hypothetical protein
MSNNKQSSIMWLYEKMFVHRGNITIEEFEQAKAMHKEEIIQSYASGSNDRLKKNAINTNYYNETFNQY